MLSTDIYRAGILDDIVIVGGDWQGEGKAGRANDRCNEDLCWKINKHMNEERTSDVQH